MGSQAITSKWDVDEVSQQVGEGDVPTSPKVDDAGGTIRGGKIFWKLEIEATGKAEGHVRVG